MNDTNIDILLGIIDDYTIGDPSWENKPQEWRRKTRAKLAESLLDEIEVRIHDEIEEFDAAQW